MKYKLWLVYSEEGTKYYVVNITVKQIQSSWKSFDIAASVVRDLNRYENEKREEAVNE